MALAASPPAFAGGFPTSVAGRAERLGAAPAGASLSSGPPRAVPLRSRDPEAVAAAHRRAASRFGPLGPSSSGLASDPAPRSSVILNQPGLSDSSVTPPDSTGSIGPNSYIEVVNSQIALYDRGTLASVASSTLDAFTADPSPGDCDSQMQWDQQAQRFLYVSLHCVGGTERLLMGWSKTADPTNLTSDWCRFRFDTGTTLEDYPKLGHNDNYAIVGTNSFADRSSYTGSKLLFFDKPVNGDSTCPASLTVRSTALPSDIVTPEPANLADASATGYVVSAADASGGSASQLFLTQVTGNRGEAPTVTAGTTFTVSPFSIPPLIPQPGTFNTLDSLDARLTQAVGRSDPSAAGNPEAIWTQHTIDKGGRSQVRWYELIPGQSTPRQEGAISSATEFAFNGAISPTRTGDAAAIFYNQGSSTNLVSLRSQSRTAAAPLGGMGGEAVLGTSSDADTDFSCSPCRWGDYAGASPDPSDDDTVWGSNQLNGPSTGGSQWITRNFAVATVPSPSLAPQATSISDPTPGGDADGVAEPGESIRVDEQIQNTGDAPATNVTGTLSSSTPGVTITQGSSSYPSPIAPGGTATNSTPFEATITSSLPCGAEIQLSLQLNTTQGNFTIPITVPTGTTGPVQSQTSTDVPQPIPDLGTGNSTLDITSTESIKDVNVRIGSITHTFDGDLVISIIAPDGTSVVLASRLGGGGDNFISTVFDDAAATPIASGSPPFTGTFRPGSPLSMLNGHPASGTWTLRAQDTVGGGSGSINDWGLDFRTAQCAATSPPTATTGAASGVGQTAATLNGQVDPRGAATGYRFEYGTTNAYGSLTPVGDAGSGSGDVAESAALTGLSATTYHFRIVAIRNGVVVATGADATFQTAPPDPAATTGAASGVGQTMATLGADATFITGSGLPVGDKTPPALEVALKSTYRWSDLFGAGGSKSRSAATRGLKVRVRCNEPCRVTLALVLNGKKAKRLKLAKSRKAVVVALGSATVLAPAKTVTLVINPTTAARKRLPKVKRLVLAIAGDAVDASGNASTVGRNLKFRR